MAKTTMKTRKDDRVLRAAATQVVCWCASCGARIVIEPASGNPAFAAVAGLVVVTHEGYGVGGKWCEPFELRTSEAARPNVFHTIHIDDRRESLAARLAAAIDATLERAQQVAERYLQAPNERVWFVAIDAYDEDADV